MWRYRSSVHFRNVDYIHVVSRRIKRELCEQRCHVRTLILRISPKDVHFCLHQDYEEIVTWEKRK